jgi:hypothetical protein
MNTVLSVLHFIVAYSAFAAWGIGMYYWWQANNNLNSGVSKTALLNPASYFNNNTFTQQGIYSRNKAIAAFMAMLLLTLIGYGLRHIIDAGTQ